MRGIDEDRVGAWLAENVEGAVAPFRFDLIAGGRSNLTFLVTNGAGGRWVLRRPPLGDELATAHDMGREYRIIHALGPTAVPVPTAYAMCADDSVNGGPFYVMEYVDGVVLDTAEKAQLLSMPARHEAGLALADVLADLHAVDVDAVGLGDLGPRENHLARQIRRFSRQWAAVRTRDLPAVEQVRDLLAANIPPQQGVALVHGDFRFGNAMVDRSSGRILAVLDWELASLGDAMADVGFLAVTWTFRGFVPEVLGGDGEAGFPRTEELLERYAKRSGRDLSGLDYYVAFASWRMAVIKEGVYARYAAGAMSDHLDMDKYRTDVEILVDRALELLQRA